LCEHITRQRLEHTLTLYAVDTFSSFTKADINYEVTQRGKRLADLKAFAYNDYEVLKRTFADYPFVVPVMADCTLVD
jgi:hypothetical protein